MLKNGDELLHLSLHLLEGNTLVSLHHAVDAPGIRLGKEALRYVDEELDVENDHGGKREHDETRVAERHIERPAVSLMSFIEKPVRESEETACFAVLPPDKQTRAHHRCRRQRYKERNDDR